MEPNTEVNPTTPPPPEFQVPNVAPPTEPAPTSLPPQVPSQPGPIGPQPLPVKKKSRKLLLLFILILVLLIAAGSYWLLVKKNKSTPTPAASSQNTSTQTASVPRLVLSDITNKKIIVTDTAGKVVSSNAYTNKQFSNFVAATPAGGVLMALNSSTSGQKTSYTFIDKDGNAQDLSQTVADIINAGNGDRGSNLVFFQDETTAWLTTCTYQISTKDNDCKLISLNINDGTTKTVVEVTTPQASDTGAALFVLRGMLAAKATAFLEVSGPTKLSSSQDAIFSVDLKTGTYTKVADIDYTNQEISIAPDGSNFAYQTATNNGSNNVVDTFHIINVSTGKATTVNWDKPANMVSNVPLSWSPDGTKILFQGTENSSSVIDIAYLDLSTKTIKNLQSVSDSGHNNVPNTSWGWLGNSTIVYELDTLPASAAANDFTNATTQVFKENITTLQPTKISTPAGGLLSQVIWVK